MTIIYPCRECDNTVLYQLPKPYEHVSECSICRYPNDTPKASEIYLYNDMVQKSLVVKKMIKLDRKKILQILGIIGIVILVIVYFILQIMRVFNIGTDV